MDSIQPVSDATLPTKYQRKGTREGIGLTHQYNPGTLVSIIQNNAVSFSFLQITYLGITQSVCSIASTFGFWYFQKYFKIRTKSMFLFTNFFSAFIPFWGMIGLWTNRIGYHHRVSIYSVQMFPAYKPISGNSISTMLYSAYSKLLTTPYVKANQPLPEKFFFSF